MTVVPSDIINIVIVLSPEQNLECILIIDVFDPC